jgi:hypothetical protein
MARLKENYCIACVLQISVFDTRKRGEIRQNRKVQMQTAHIIKASSLYIQLWQITEILCNTLRVTQRNSIQQATSLIELRKTWTPATQHHGVSSQQAYILVLNFCYSSPQVTGRLKQTDVYHVYYFSDTRKPGEIRQNPGVSSFEKNSLFFVWHSKCRLGHIVMASSPYIQVWHITEML